MRRRLGEGLTGKVDSNFSRPILRGREMLLVVRGKG